MEVLHVTQYVHWKSGIPKYVIVLIWMKVPGLTKHCVKTEIQRDFPVVFYLYLVFQYG